MQVRTTWRPTYKGSRSSWLPAPANSLPAVEDEWRQQQQQQRRLTAAAQHAPLGPVAHQQLARHKHQHAAAQAGLRVQRADVVLALLEGQRRQLAQDLQSSRAVGGWVGQQGSGCSKAEDAARQWMCGAAEAQHSRRLCWGSGELAEGCRLQGLGSCRQPAGSPNRLRPLATAMGTALDAAPLPHSRTQHPRQTTQVGRAARATVADAGTTHRLRAQELLPLKRQHALLLVQPRQVGPRRVEGGIIVVGEGLRLFGEGVGAGMSRK
jgi:hypothetical protein